MNSVFKLLIFFIVVIKGLYTSAQQAPAPGVPPYPYPVQNACLLQLQNYQATKSGLQGKCGGVVLNDCLEEAKNCRSDSNDSSVNPGLSSISSMLTGTIMAGLTGGFPMVGAQGPGAFKCLPTTRLDKIISNMEKLKKDSETAEQKAKDYLNKIDDKKEDLNKQIGDMKKELAQKLKDRANANLKLPEDIKKLKKDAAKETSDLLEEIRGQENAVAKAVGDIEMTENERGRLYLNTIGKCAEDLADSKDKRLQQFFQEQQKLEADLATVVDLNSRYKISSAFKRKIKHDEKTYQDAFKEQYDRCFKAQTEAYKTNYIALTRKITDLSKEIKDQEEKKKDNLQKIKQIPIDLTESTVRAKGMNEQERQAALSEMTATYQQMQQSITNYQDQSSKANKDYDEARRKLNMAQVQVTTNQSIYQMNTFGDAAPMLDGVSDSRMLVCDFCKKAEDGRPKWCPSDGSEPKQDATK